MKQNILLIVVATVLAFTVTTYMLIPLTKLLFNISIILIPTAIIAVGSYLALKQIFQRGK
ncbi:MULTISPECIES: hypothetical protein [Shewanella]|uniref:hypothetical protein n=1 Tax=Shewanella TaxID=22 RepID=UPI00048FE3F8|nr:MULTISPECIES: hypothetical protein [Shewanella]QLE85554.1 hypothetical protein FLM48_10975 [Shewanella sp. Scap07]